MTNHDLQPVEHFLTGPAEQLANVLRAADARGHLVRYGRPQSLGGGRYAIGVTLLEPVPRPRWYRRIRWRLIGQVAAAVAGFAALGGLGWGVWLLIAWVTAHLTAVIVTSVLVLVIAGGIAAQEETRGRGRR
ncbi:hypothetical protein ABT369_15455 [Dactylosporangium sp. NPDC000244]|uniref:hypothetical protein n=1 Tax=Dactylosporangium sp. NPDC000244 TaxID=3154365 RepID=UPI00331A35BA